MTTSTERDLAVALRRIADEAAPPEPRSDLWAKGLRRHRWRVAAAATSVIAVIALVVSIPIRLPAPERVGPAEPEGPVIPTTITGTVPFTRTVQDAPNGPASLIMDGVGGSDLGYEDHVLVVGLDRSYRILRNVNGVIAGLDVLLSPDGRYVSGNWNIEGVPPVGQPIRGAVVDLVTGQVDAYPELEPLAWSTDGRLLARPWANDPRGFNHIELGHLALLDVTTGRVTNVASNFDITVDAGVRRFAFSPDGSQFVAEARGVVRICDLATGEVRALAASSLATRQLAGPGAWRSDGRIAIWQVTGRSRRLVLVSADGPAVEETRMDVITADTARLLGWQDDGDAVVQIFSDVERSVNAADVSPSENGLYAYHPGGGRTLLVEASNNIDVARRYIDDDRFGAPPRGLLSRIGEMLGTRPVESLVALAVLAVVVRAWIRSYRRRRAEYQPIWHGDNRQL